MNARRRTSSAAALALIIGAVLAGCGSGSPTLAGSDINEDSAAFVLSSIESDWRGDLAGDDATIHEDARCYLVTTGDGATLAAEQAEGVSIANALCGPARRITADQGQVWDAYEVLAVVGADNEISFGEFEGSGSDEALNGRTLWRPDGEEPPGDAAELAAPPAPPADAGLLEILEQSPEGVKDLKDVSTALVSPDLGVELTGVGSLSVYKDQAGTPQRPADGHQFLVLRLRTNDGAAYPDKDSWGIIKETTPQVFLSVDGERKDLAVASATGGADAELYVVASVREGEATELGLRAAGVDQVMALPGGERKPGTAEAFYREKPVVAVTQSIPSQELVEGDFEGEIRATFESVYLTPWDAEKGWAPQGQAWLAMPFEGYLREPSGSYNYKTALLPGSMVATVDGTAATFVPELLEEGRLVWQVPATAKTVKFTLTPKYRGEAVSPEYTDPDTAQVTGKSATFEVTFP